MAKKMYWLKFKDDFFDQKEIKKLRRIAGGDTYVLIYLKMLLKSIKTDGVLAYDGIEDTFEDELALDLNEDTENVKIVVSYLLRYGLVIRIDNDDKYALIYAGDNIGSESESAARVRHFRERQKSLQCNVSVMLCNTEQEQEQKRKEQQQEQKRDEPQKKDVLMMLLSIGCNEQQALDLIKTYGAEVIQVQLKLLACQDNVRNPVGWLLIALRDGYVNPLTVIAAEKEQKKIENDKLRQIQMEIINQETIASTSMQPMINSFLNDYKKYKNLREKNG
jgi:predicted phage replisome organizer